LLSVCMLVAGFFAFKKIEDDARVHGTLATN